MTVRVASLGMYDHPAQRDANDRLWSAIAEILRADGVSDVPDRLDRTRDVQTLWHDPTLLFAQACGYPLVADPTLALIPLAFPIYAVPHCEGATHRSVVVARHDDPRGAIGDFRGCRAAMNDRHSNTGMNLFRATIAPIAGSIAEPIEGRVSFFDTVVETGAHRASIVAVRAGEADIAAIDAVTHAALARFEPDLVSSLKIVAQSPISPSLPFVTAATTDPTTRTRLQAALRHVVADPALAGIRATLFLTGVEPAHRGSLVPIIRLKDEAALAGYAELR